MHPSTPCWGASVLSLWHGEGVSEEDATGGVGVHLRGEQHQQQLHSLHVDIVGKGTATANIHGKCNGIVNIIMFW